MEEIKLVLTEIGRNEGLKECFFMDSLHPP